MNSETVDPLSIEHAYALARVIETAAEVRRRYQFFIWSQTYLHTLVPHKLAVCGAYQRTRRDVGFEAFNSIPMPTPLLSAITDGGSALMQEVVGAWIERRGRALLMQLDGLAGGAADGDRERLVSAGFGQLLVHGVSRPQRPAELESLFVFGMPGRHYGMRDAIHLDLLLPHVHAVWLRVQSTERELSGASAPAQARPTTTRAPITERENQILYWVREGKSNQEIGEQLGISVLTVKNHVQKILRKLGASNRAQAVARAMTMNLLPAYDPSRRTGSPS